jgi:hypothetical protein
LHRIVAHGLDLPRRHVFGPVHQGSELCGEQKANPLKSGCMARRPESHPILSRDELAEFSRRLAMLSVDGVEGVYRTAHRDSAYDGKKTPPAAAVQQLVAAWKILRRMHRAE